MLCCTAANYTRDVRDLAAVSTIVIPVLLAATLLTIPPASSGASQRSVDALPSPAGVRLVWSEGDDAIRSTVVDPDGTIEPVVRIDSADGATVASPHVACGAGDCLAAWLESDATRLSVIARFIGSGEPFTIATNSLKSIDDIALAWTGTDYVVAWSGSVPILSAGGAARVTTSGTILPLSGPPGLRASFSSPDVAPLDNDALIAWSEWVPDPLGLTTTRIEVARASEIAAVKTIATMRVTDNGNAGQRYVLDPRLMCDAGACLLTWTLRNGPGRGSETHFAQFAPALDDIQPIDEPPPFTLPFLGTFGYLIHSVPLWDGTHFRIVSGVYDVEERVVYGNELGSALTIGAASSDVAVSIDAAQLNERSHIVAYTQHTLSDGYPERLYVWIVSDSMQRRRAVRP